MTRNEAKKYRATIEQAAQSLDDDTALAFPTLFPTWEAGVYYEEGQRVYYEGVLYKVPQTHTSMSIYPPGEGTEALYSEVLPGQDGTEIGEWVQPDSTNGYQKGDRVIYNGQIYESVYEGSNVWSPDAYPDGWVLVEE